MKIAIAASEATPFAKTGGLADVVGALPKSLAGLGCDVKVFLPKYSSIDDAKFDLQYEYSIGEMQVRVAGIARSVHVLRSTLPGSSVEVYFIHCPHYFHRSTIYTSDADEDERFILFSKAVVEVLQRLQWAPDVLHCNDWQTGLIPLLLKDNYAWDRHFEGTATLLSIHNIGYQGLFPPSTLGKAELRRDLFYPGGPIELHKAVCFLKAGILYSEVINTVSETYAQEILTPEYGAGMESVLLSRQKDLHGVLNGIDEEIWNPGTDTHLPFTYSVTDMKGKLENKKFLCKHTGLPFEERLPLIGIISRLVQQKGFDLVADAINELMGMEAQWVILGSGEERFETLFRAMAQALPHKVWTYIGFNNDLSHLIEAGADIFLMPSRYEPCGLNQMYSLRYGTVPIVRHTGGLADTVQDWHHFATQGQQSGNGFSFHDATGNAVSATLYRALQTWKDKETWRTLQKNGMARDYSWNLSAKKYIDLYGKALKLKHGG